MPSTLAWVCSELIETESKTPLEAGVVLIVVVKCLVGISTHPHSTSGLDLGHGHSPTQCHGASFGGSTQHPMDLV